MYSVGKILLGPVFGQFQSRRPWTRPLTWWQRYLQCVLRMMISFRKLRLEKNISIFIAGELARFSAWQPHLLPRGLNMFHKSWMLKPLYYTSKTCCKKTRTMFSKKVFPSSQSPAELAFQVQQPASVSSPYCPLPWIRKKMNHLRIFPKIVDGSSWLIAWFRWCCSMTKHHI